VYVSGDYQDAATFERLRAALGAAVRPVFYLAIPPSLFGVVASSLARSGMAAQARLIVEKPFGRDLASARALNVTLHESFPEEAVYRRWYLERYHSPADDLKQPWDPAAADKFNTFFGRVVEALADAPQRPQWKPGSPYAPK